MWLWVSQKNLSGSGSAVKPPVYIFRYALCFVFFCVCTCKYYAFPVYDFECGTFYIQW